MRTDVSNHRNGHVFYKFKRFLRVVGEERVPHDQRTLQRKFTRKENAEPSTDIREWEVVKVEREKGYRRKICGSRLREAR